MKTGTTNKEGSNHPLIKLYIAVLDAKEATNHHGGECKEK